MDFLARLADWFTAPGNWSGDGGIPVRMLEHLQLSIPPVAIAAAVALPLGVWLGHVRRGALLTISIANIGRATPSFALLVLFIPIAIRAGLGLTYWPIVFALILLAVPPMLTNTYTGVREVDAQIVEAARGMGLGERQIVTGIEVPLALPVILTGMRIAAVQVVATAPLGSLAGAGGLGRYIIDGLANRDIPQVVGGGVLVAALSVVTELLFSAAERRAVSPGIGTRRRVIGPGNAGGSRVV